MPSKFELLITLGNRPIEVELPSSHHLTLERPLALPNVALAPVQRPPSLLTSSSGGYK
jgi:hypothetical protein